MKYLKKRRNIKYYDIPNDIKHQKVYELISKKVDKIYPQIINLNESKYLENKNSNKIKRLQSASYILLFLTFIILGLMVFANFKLSKNFTHIIGIFFVISIITTFILFFLYSQFHRPMKKLIRYFTNPQVISQFYENYTEVFYPKIFINEVNNTIDDIVNRFFPISGYSNVWNSNILHGKFKETSFAIGTKIYKYRHYTTDHKGNTSVYYEYKEHLYAISYCDKFDCQISLRSSRLFNRGRKDLESSEFDKKFAFDYSDDIKARQVLQPKVMSKLLDLSNSNKKIPNISLFNDIILINQATRIWTDNSNKSAYFASLDYYIGTIEQLKKAIMYTIEEDLKVINNVVQWIEAFNLHRNYDVHHLNSGYGDGNNDKKSN